MDSAIADFSTAIRLDPAYAESWRDWGALYAWKGDYYWQMAADYGEAAWLEPADAAARGLHGLATS